MKKNKGFTLIELLVVIGIIAILTGLGMSNFLGARERARDVKKKSELNQLKNALRLYYNDYQSYPKDDKSGNIQGCGPTGQLTCGQAEDVSCSTAEFAAGGADGCATIYMKKLPFFGSSPSEGPGFTYKQVGATGEDFLLETTLDNTSDPDIAASESRCQGCTKGSYCVCP